jgi:ABC-type amino acid transport substrate-binding protein
MTMRKTGPVKLLAALVALALLASCTGQESTWDRVRRNGTLRVGLDPTFPPFEFNDGTSLEGLDIDLARAIAAEKDLTTEFLFFGYDGLYDALATEQVDLLISALTPDPTRTRDFVYSDGYVDSGLVLVSLVTRPYGEVAALQGRRVAVELGAAGHVEATTWQRQVQDLVILTFASSDEALQALADGEADVAVVDNITYLLFDRSATDDVFSAVLITSEPYAIVVRREDEQLLAEMDDALARLRDSGRLDDILDRWLSG